MFDVFQTRNIFPLNEPVIKFKPGTIDQLDDEYKDAIVGLWKEYCSEETFNKII